MIHHRVGKEYKLFFQLLSEIIFTPSPIASKRKPAFLLCNSGKNKYRILLWSHAPQEFFYFILILIKMLSSKSLCWGTDESAKQVADSRLIEFFT